MTQQELEKLDVFKKMPTLQSSDNDWLKWAEILHNEIGLENTKTNFIALWEKRGSKKANTNKLRRELSKNYDIDIDENFFQKIVDVGVGVGSSLKKAAKIGIWITGGLAVVAVVILAVNISKQGKLTEVLKK